MVDKIWRPIKAVLWTVAAILILVFREEVVLLLNYLVGGIMVAYGLETVVLHLVKKESFKKENRFFWGLIEVAIGITLIFLIDLGDPEGIPYKYQLHAKCIRTKKIPSQGGGRSGNPTSIIRLQLRTKGENPVGKELGQTDTETIEQGLQLGMDSQQLLLRAIIPGLGLVCKLIQETRQSIHDLWHNIHANTVAIQTSDDTLQISNHV